MMRISNNMMTYNFLSSFNKSLSLINDVQEKLSDGKIFHRPSDDPIRAFRSLKFNVNLTMNEQYTQNVQDAIEWMNQTDSALSDLSNIMISAKETVIQAISANPSDSQMALGEKIDGLINQAITTANTQIGDRYVFAGQQDKVNGGPFERVAINVGTPPVATEYVIYKGDLNKISMTTQAGAPNPKRDSVNVTGEEVFGPLTTVTDSVTGVSYQTADIFSNLLEVKNQLLSGTPDLTALSNTALANIDQDHGRILLAQTNIGARMASYEMIQNMMRNENTTISENISANDDLDIAKATMQFKNYENVYNAALSMGAKIMPASLADYLK